MTLWDAMGLVCLLWLAMGGKNLNLLMSATRRRRLRMRPFSQSLYSLNGLGVADHDVTTTSTWQAT